MIRTGAIAHGNVAAVLVGVAVLMLTGCAAPGSVSALSAVSAVPSSPVASSPVPSSGSASPATPAATSVANAFVTPSADASPPSSTDPGLGDTRPPCPPAQFQLILGPNAAKSVWTSSTVHRPYGDVGVDFGPQQPDATVLWARLDVVVTDTVPLMTPDPASPRAYESAESARPDSEEKLAAGTDPHVARVTLDPFAPGPFVLPAAVLNSLPSGSGTYTVYLVDSVDESVCFSTAPGSPAVPSVLSNGYSVIAQLAP
jgi:hypothetical protein